VRHVIDPDPGLLKSKPSIRSNAARSVGKRVVVLYEPGRTGSAALDLAGRLVGDDGSALTVVTVAPQDRRICCGAGSAIDYNRAVCEAAGAELRRARQLLGRVGNCASFKLLVETKDPPLTAWIAAGGFDVVVLPARRRPVRSTKHPAADELRKSTSAEVRVVHAGSSFEEPRIEILGSPLATSDPRLTAFRYQRARASTRVQDRYRGRSRAVRDRRLLSDHAELAS
jgi:hypothetical protein